MQVLEADGHCSVMNPMADHDGPVVDSVLGKRKRSVAAAASSDVDKFIPGYTPRRGDFEVDYDDCAELLLADMEFNPSDRPEDTKIKADVLLAYNARLSLREEMKRYVVARQMVLQQPPCSASAGGGGVPAPPPVNAHTRAGQILSRLLRPVERFFDSKDDCEEFKQLLLEEQRIEHRLEELEGIKSEETASIDAPARQGTIPDAWMRKHVLRKRRVNKDIVKSECVKNLGEQELAWCEEVDVSPHHFALVRDALVREALKGTAGGGGGGAQLVLKISRAEPLSRTFKFELEDAGENAHVMAPRNPERASPAATAGG
ncbi:conserved hypothetical protein [Perkinsus marinus ATCC 50983]|uniref:Transcriptional adapter 2-alpha/beta-like domain-containing protein n=1 Tax=Perkinsus marinus (strain ATCC 50983 / TXsc) TaxID=423536 RepID=C5LVF9_PERM5|nr:conserved hypothetical protein [Perkinsus marinus ATCC 50983]EEQ99287.1 conserved hypothetical protein [Perkinsus marinus ATCC 50983]|eukprot:XP_002766570.1 conserved hypothetical protein [Perkinsus marinus ATCC 50983]